MKKGSKKRTTPAQLKKAAEFLSVLRDTGGNVSRACAAINQDRRRVYEWREKDPLFAQAWDEAVESGTDELEEEARRRAFAGVDEPVFYQGEMCGTVRKYSDTLLIFLLKGRRPDKWRENVKHEHSNPDGSPLLQPIGDALVKIYGSGAAQR